MKGQKGQPEDGRPGEGPGHWVEIPGAGLVDCRPSVVLFGWPPCTPRQACGLGQSAEGGQEG